MHKYLILFAILTGGSLHAMEPDNSLNQLLPQAEQQAVTERGHAQTLSLKDNLTDRWAALAFAISSHSSMDRETFLREFNILSRQANDSVQSDATRRVKVDQTGLPTRKVPACSGASVND